MMEYSIVELAKLTSISVRTLHHYDEVGLLKPLYRMGNGRRYYGVEEMLRLQEILYFKELGFKLSKIKTLIQTKNLTKASMLSLQKEALLKEIQRLQKLTKSIDRTIDHYKRCKMTDQEVANQFKDFQKNLSCFEQVVDKRFGEGTIEKTKGWVQTIDQDTLKAVAEQSLDLINRLVDAMKNELAVDSSEVQNLLQEHYELSTTIQPMTKEAYLLSREMLRDAPGYYTILHPQLPEFLYLAMGIYADNL